MATHTDFSRIFIDRPILATVLSALILVSGLMAIPNLPISEYPDVVPPSVSVTANYPGANPRTIADTVAGPLEEAINGVENMIYMKSTSSSDGAMQLAVTFKGGTDVDLAAMQVQNRVAQALPRLPEAVRALGVTTVKASSTLTMVVHLDSPNKTYDALYLSNFANLHVRDELARLPGVGQALAFGIGNYAMRVWIDPARAASARPLGERHRQRDPRAERPGFGRQHRQPADAGRLGAADLGQCPGATRIAGGFRRDRAEGRRRPAHTAQGRCPRRARRQQLCDPLAPQQRGRCRDRDLRGAGRQHDRAVRCDPQADVGARGQLP